MLALYHKKRYLVTARFDFHSEYSIADCGSHSCRTCLLACPVPLLCCSVAVLSYSVGVDSFSRQYTTALSRRDQWGFWARFLGFNTSFSPLRSLRLCVNIKPFPTQRRKARRGTQRKTDSQTHNLLSAMRHKRLHCFSINQARALFRLAFDGRSVGNRAVMRFYVLTNDHFYQGLAQHAKSV